MAELHLYSTLLADQNEGHYSLSNFFNDSPIELSFLPPVPNNPESPQTTRSSTDDDEAYGVTDYSLSYEVIKEHFGRKLEDAAESLNVSRSTLKRICRKFGIRRWPSQRRKKVKQSHSNLTHLHELVQSEDEQIPKSCNRETSSSDLSPTQATAAVAQVQDQSSVAIKATFGEDIIKFQLSFSSGMAELVEKVARRLNFKVGALLRFKYQDDDGDLVLVTCDEDLQDCIRSSGSLGKSAIKFVVQPVTCPRLVDDPNKNLGAEGFNNYVKSSWLPAPAKLPVGGDPANPLCVFFYRQDTGCSQTIGDLLMNSAQTTTEQGQGDDSTTADFQFEKVRHDIGKYLLTELYRQPRPASSPYRRYLYPLWVFCNRDSYESDLSHALSSASFSELIAPTVSDSLVIKEKIRTLLTLLVLRVRHILVQFWAPITIGGQCLLSTSGQPFGLGIVDEGLCLYRMDTLHYKYTVDNENDDNLGIPGRVFRKKLPEWTPNVRHYFVKDYPQKECALRCNIQGSLALPVFEPYGQQCVGVLELVMYHEYLDCTYEVQEVCRALKEVDLMSSVSFGHPRLQVHRNLNTNIIGEGYQNKLDKIYKGLEMVCNAHSLPLAQTWTVSECMSTVANNQSLEKSCDSFNQSCMGQVCMSTASLPFYLSDAHMWQFRKACTEHHLRKGQGVVGLALTMHNLCLCNDITVLKETEYPFVDLAIKYGLSSCFTVCMDDIYITEFFLPPKIKDQRDIQRLVESILITLKQHFQSFKATFSSDLVFTKIISVLSNGRHESIPFSQNIESPLVPRTLAVEAEKPQIGSSDLQLMEEDDAINYNWNTASAEQSVSFSSLLEKKSDTAVTFAEKKDDSDVISSEREDSRKIPNRKRRRNEKAISLENIQQQFGKRIEEAAEILGVSRSTLKRICRQHDIDRWAKRKLEKDNSSSKIKQTKESSRASEGAFHPTVSLITRSGLVDLTKPSNFIRHDQPNSRLMFEDVLQNPNDLVQGERPSESTVHLKDLRNFPSIPETSGTNHQLSDFPTQQTNFPPQQALVCVTDMAPPIPAIQGGKTVNIKATYKDTIIKFSFSLSAGLVELEEQVARRLKLKHGSFVLKYKDGDGDWISITCDTDLYYASGNSRVQLTLEKWRSKSCAPKLIVFADISWHLQCACGYTREVQRDIILYDMEPKPWIWK